jgi:hypothetical protein
MIGVNKYTSDSKEIENSLKNDEAEDKPWILPSLTLSKYI